MMYRIRELLRGKLMAALLSIALGIVIIIARRAALDLLVKIMGGLVITVGVAMVAVYLTRPDPSRGNLKMVLMVAGVAALAGLLLITCAETVVDFFPTMMGILLILNGLSHLAAAGVVPENRFVTVASGVIAVAFGVLLVMRPGFIADAMMIYIGAFFILNGLMDLAVVRQLSGD